MPTGLRHDDLRKLNRAKVLSSVRRSSRPSRTEIAASTGLSHSTISAISSDLIAEGALVQLKGVDTPELRRGRPQIALGLNPDAAVVITVVLSLNSLSTRLVDYAGQTVFARELRVPTQTIGRDELIEAVVSSVSELMLRPERKNRSVPRVAMAIQGVIDAARRTLLWSPITPHENIAFADAIETALSVPVTVENDCNMIAVALRERDPRHGDGDLVAVLLSNGIGMGLILGGRLFTGSRSSAGEFGHMIFSPEGALCRCGRSGCIEAYAGNYAIMRNARGGHEHDEPDADIDESAMLELATRARAKRGPERDAFRVAGQAIGYGLGSLFALIDPAPVVIVGSGTAAFDIIEPELRGALSSTAGGQHAEAIEIELETDERPLIAEGCAWRALSYIDEEIFAAGHFQSPVVA